MAAYLTPEQIADPEREVMRRRGERIRAEAAKAEGAAAEPADPPPADVLATWVIGNGPHFSPEEMQELVGDYRAQYVNYDDELIALKEERLRETLAKSGIKLEPLPPADREKLLMARHMAKSIEN
jgi:hypothetical protein